MHAWMMNGWMVWDGWMDGWIGMDGWMDEGWMDGWVGDEWMETRKEGRKDGWMNGWMMDGWTDRRTDGRKDGKGVSPAERSCYSLVPTCINLYLYTAFRNVSLT